MTGRGKDKARGAARFVLRGADARAEAKLDRLVTVTIAGEKRRMKLRDAIALIVVRRCIEAVVARAEGEP